jgi:hypothetical protein
VLASIVAIHERYNNPTTFAVVEANNRRRLRLGFWWFKRLIIVVASRERSAEPFAIKGEGLQTQVFDYVKTAGKSGPLEKGLFLPDIQWRDLLTISYPAPL